MTLRLAIGDHVARLFIDRPDKRNAFNQAMWARQQAGLPPEHIDAAVITEATARSGPT